MSDQLPGIFNYLIGIGLLTFALLVIKRKHMAQPQLKVMGLSLPTVILLLYIAIAINVLLMIALLMGWSSR